MTHDNLSAKDVEAAEKWTKKKAFTFAPEIQNQVKDIFLAGIEHARKAGRVKLSESERERIELIKDSVNKYWFVDNPNGSEVNDEIDFLLLLVDRLTAKPDEGS